MANRINPKSFSQLLGQFNTHRFDDLEALARSLISRAPADGRVWQLYGVSFLARGSFERALPALEKAARLLPEQASIWDNLGLIHFNLGNHERAAVCFERATRLDPGQLSAWVNWSSSALKAGEAARACEYAERALAIDSRQPGAYLNLGNALADLGRLAEAERAYREAYELAPGWAEVELSLASLYGGYGRFQEALALLEDMVFRQPDDWRAHANIGRLHFSLGNTCSARESYARAVAINPDANEAHSGLLFHLLHEEAVDGETVFRAHRDFGSRLEASFRAQWGRHANDPDPNRRLRIGLVSGDLRAHAMAFFMEPLMRAFRDSSLDIYVYANQPTEDAVSVRLMALVAQWRKALNQGDADLAARIQSDRIDILIDLSGHTGYNRLPVFARKPAPIQLTWLGYPGTTGLEAMDYRFIYAVSAPPGLLDSQFTEKLVYLPYPITFENPRDAPEINALPALSNGYITFASLNRPNKIGSGLIEIWSRILHAVPDSRMLIGGIFDDSTTTLLSGWFETNGVGPERVVFRKRLPLQEYLALHHEIDLILDTYPYNGGTTTNHALWMGVPSVTLAGSALAQRSGAAIMGKVGLTDWVTETEQDYVARAVRAAGELEQLSEIRARLREQIRNRENLRPERIAGSIESAFRMMWQRWCRGEKPVSFEVPG